MAARACRNKTRPGLSDGGHSVALGQLQIDLRRGLERILERPPGGHGSTDGKSVQRTFQQAASHNRLLRQNPTRTAAHTRPDRPGMHLRTYLKMVLSR
ncbi:hypothetical protein D9M68_971190 [compost metagenome]